MSSLDVWEINFERVKKSAEMFPELTELCDSVLDSMWDMKDRLLNVVRTQWGDKELPPSQKFVSIYFIRNIMYLRGAYLLACGSLCEPSRNLQRTVTETIMRSYLFLVNPREANLMDSLIKGTIKPEDRDFLRHRKYWSFKFLLGELYTKEIRKSFKKILHRLSRSSHASIMSAFTDLKYSSQSVEDCLSMILALSYHNIQIIAEGFLGLLDDNFKDSTRKVLKEIADLQREITPFEPDKEKYSKKIKLKRGNFPKILK